MKKVLSSYLEKLARRLETGEEEIFEKAELPSEENKEEKTSGNGWLKRLLSGETDREKKEVSSSILQPLAGGVSYLGEFYFPTELLGGCCPHIPGEEEETVWNAAAEAADSERIHVVWQTKGDKIWFLAVRSAEMSSHPNTWCPFASLLPGMSDAGAIPACYTYYSDEAATMMTITADSLQIHRGTSSVVRAKAERMARALGDIQVTELFPDRIEKLTPVLWYSQSLFEDRSRRVLALVSVASALAVSALGLFLWFLIGVSVINARADIDEIQERTQDKTMALLKTVQNLRASPVREELAKFADVNDGLIALNGWLDVYRIDKDTTLWKAVVPVNVTADRIRDLGGQTLDTSSQGVVIGNSRDALNMKVR